MSDVEDKVVQIVQASEDPAGSDVTLSTGAVIRGVSIPDLMLQAVYRGFPMPKPPRVTNEVKGKKWEEDNPNDPKYLAALDERTRELNMAMINLVLLKGMEIVSLPAGVIPLDDPEWESDLVAIGMDIPPDSKRRYLLWLTTQVATSSLDLVKIQQAALSLSAVTEEAIQAEMDRFQR